MITDVYNYVFIIMVDPETTWFDLHGFTSSHTFFIKYIVGLPHPQFSHLQIKPTTDRNSI